MMFMLQTDFCLLMCHISVASASRTSLMGLGLLRTTSLGTHYPVFYPHHYYTPYTVFQNIYILVFWSFLSFEKEINKTKHYPLRLPLMLKADIVI